MWILLFPANKYKGYYFANSSNAVLYFFKTLAATRSIFHHLSYRSKANCPDRPAGTLGVHSHR